MQNFPIFKVGLIDFMTIFDWSANISWTSKRIKQIWTPVSSEQEPGRLAQSVAWEPEVPVNPGSIPGPATYFRFSFRWFDEGSCQLLAKSMGTEYWLTT